MTRRSVISLGVFLAAFGWYAHGCFPGLSVGDAGEFMTAGATLGVPHAPGFPTYILFANAFHRLLPWGSTALHFNLFSAFCGAATVALVFLAALELTTSMGLALGAALLFFGLRAQLMYSQATEVFSLHLAFGAAAMLAVLRDRPCLAAFLIGLGFGAHQTVLLIVPALLLLRSSLPAARDLSGWAGAFALGFSTHALILIRGSKAPFLNIGRADTLERWWRVLTRADYGTLTLALGDVPERSLATTLQHLARFATGLWSEGGWLVAIGAAVGLVAWRGHPRRVKALLAGFVLTGPFFFILGNLPFNAQSTGLLSRFYLSPALFAVLLSAMGLASLLKTRPAWGWVSVLMVPLLWPAPGDAYRLRHDYRAHAYGLNTLRSLPPRATFVMDGGDDTFYATAYLTAVEGRRPDVRLHDRGGVVLPGLYGDDFRALPATEKDARRQAVERSLVSTGTPLVYSTMNPNLLPGVSLAQHGLVYLAGVPSASGVLWSIYDLRGVRPWFFEQTPDDYRLRALLPFYAFERAVFEASRNDMHNALRFLTTSDRLGADVLWLRPNLAGALHRWAYDATRANDFGRAMDLYERALVIDARDAYAWSNVGAVYERLGRLADAEKAQRRAIALSPQTAQFHFNLGAVLWRQARWDEAGREFDETLRLEPTHASALVFRQRLPRRAPGR